MGRVDVSLQAVQDKLCPKVKLQPSSGGGDDSSGGGDACSGGGDASLGGGDDSSGRGGAKFGAR